MNLGNIFLTDDELISNFITEVRIRIRVIDPADSLALVAKVANALAKIKSTIPIPKIPVTAVCLQGGTKDSRWVAIRVDRNTWDCAGTLSGTYDTKELEEMFLGVWRVLATQYK